MEMPFFGGGRGGEVGVVKLSTSYFMKSRSLFLDLLMCSFNGCFKGM